MSGKVQKLRTAEDVLHRLRWCPLPEEEGTVMIGYEDRVKGPMEIALDDFVSIRDGGDIPEHRIWYFRRHLPPPPDFPQQEHAARAANEEAKRDGEDDDDAKEEDKRDEDAKDISDEDAEIKDMVLWDRFGRVDKLFGSGVGKSSGNVQPKTTQLIRASMKNMHRLEVERLERQQLRDHERRRLAWKRQLRKNAVTSPPAPQSTSTMETAETMSGQALGGSLNKTRELRERYTWHLAAHYEYSSEEGHWRSASVKPADASQEPKQSESNTSKQQLTIVSWNVLFRLNDRDENLPNREESSDDDLERWRKLVAELQLCYADIIALQEVTPDFLKILGSSQWVQENYSVGASPEYAETISPSGNMLLWRKNVGLKPLSTWICRDGVKQRSNIVALEWENTMRILLVANIHFLADPFQRSASQARQREKSSVIGQLQILESKIWQSLKTDGSLHSCVPIVVGDFNANEKQNELQDGCFEGEDILGARVCNGFFVDAWSLLPVKSDGYTFNPQTNPRAERTRAQTSQVMGPKRNDRIYIARQWTSNNPSNDVALVPVAGKLLSKDDPFPPSDHFGLSISFEVRDQQGHPGPILCSNSISNRNAWAASAESTVDSLLGIVLEQDVVGGVPFYDSESTLPIPHVTLLHGFAEFTSTQAKTLAVQACTNAVDLFLQQQGRLQGFDLAFSPSCLQVLMHQSSSTLVARPDAERETNSWLCHLYECLTASFRRCHHQESRFESGWTPHVSLAQFGTSNAARAKLVELRENDQWITEDFVVPVHAITLFQRYKVDGKIYAVASVPLTKKPPSPGRHFPLAKSFLADMGSSWSLYFHGQCEALVLEVDRACKHCAAVLNLGEARLIPTGSYALRVGLPEISDIDGVVEIIAYEECAVATSKLFFHALARHLSDVHPSAKIRSRVAGTSTSPLDILTVRLWLWAPAIDLSMCFLDTSERPTDSKSERGHRTIGDIIELRRALRRVGKGKTTDIFRLFQGVLRVVKLFAWREGVYGASMGYLGGGGYAILVARVLVEGYDSGDLTLNDSPWMASEYFFKQAKGWTSVLFALSPSLEDTNLGRREMDRAISRGTMCVLAPRSEGNHGRTSTRSTTRSTLASFGKASTLALETLLEGQLAVIESRRRCHTHAIRFQIWILKSSLSLSPTDGVDRPIVAEIRAWGNSYVLRVLGDLERHFPSFCDNLRLYSNPTRTTNEAHTCVTWFMGVSSLSEPVSTYLRTCAEACAEEIQSELHESAPSIEASLELVAIDNL